jgi:hypothetical protein
MKMKRKPFLVALAGIIMLASAFFACNPFTGITGDGDGDVNYNGQIIIKVNPDDDGDGLFPISFYAMADKISINWGDGTVEKFTPNGEDLTFSHSYAGAGIRTVTINEEGISYFLIGNYHCEELTASCPALEALNCLDNQLISLNVSGCPALKSLQCSDNQLTALNVRGYTALERLYCSDNRLTALDVSGCAALKELRCEGNQLSAGALNTLFDTLPVRSSRANIFIESNPGTSACNLSIATSKGWWVSTTAPH